MIKIAEWSEYELIDSGDGEKLEKWGEYILRRPDPQAIWKKDESLMNQWNSSDAFYHRSNSGGGQWEFKKRLPESWEIGWENLKFVIKPTGFKHTGLFPEQAVNWKWMREVISDSNLKSFKVLNLFAYTGGATVACLSAGASVVHVDASKGMIGVARDNVNLSKLNNADVRFIQDDVMKFVEREIRRGNKYEGIIMDPPSYGRGSKGEMWEIEKDLPLLVKNCKELLSDSAKFFLINSYANDLSPYSIENILKDEINRNGDYENYYLGLQSKKSKILPCGYSVRWIQK